MLFIYIRNVVCHAILRTCASRLDYYFCCLMSLSLCASLGMLLVMNIIMFAMNFNCQIFGGKL